MRILIAEDEVTIARVLKVMLEKNKYAVDMVHNGSDALDYIQAVGYDALVLDIMMPGKDGIEVLKAARAEGNTTPAQALCRKRISCPCPRPHPSQQHLRFVCAQLRKCHTGLLSISAENRFRGSAAEQQRVSAYGVVPPPSPAGVFLGAHDGKGLGP